MAALEMAAQDFMEMSAERTSWIHDSEIRQYIRTAPWDAGIFIRRQFKFSACIKKGRVYYYSKKDLISLSEELEKRNIDLKRYKEFLEDKKRFEEKINSLSGAKKLSYQIDPDLRDIQPGETGKPPADLVLRDLERLRSEFESGGLGEFIDIFRGSHAMLKDIRYFEKYLAPGLKRRCRRWCDEFNYASHALELIRNKNTDPVCGRK